MRTGMLEAPIVRVPVQNQIEIEEQQVYQQTNSMINEAGVDFGAENYYSDLARRVYLHAQIEGWTS